MDARGNVAMGRRTVAKQVERWGRRLLPCLAAVVLAWGSQAHAQATACNVVAVGSTNELAPAGTTVNFSYELVGGCAPAVDVQIAVVADATGGAVAAPTTANVPPATPQAFTLTMGPLSGQNGVVQVSCPTGGCTGTANFTFATNNVFVFTANVPVPVVTNQISAFQVGTNLVFNGGPGGLAVNYTRLPGSSLGQVAADAAGDTQLDQAIATAGNYQIVASLACPVAVVLEGCAAVAPVLFDVQVEPVSVTPVGATSVSGTAGNPVPLAVRFGSASIPAPNGTPMAWTVTAQPAGGDGVVTGGAVGAGGQSNATFNATVPGTYTVLADSGCGYCAVPTQAFNVTIGAAARQLVAITPANAAGTPGAPIEFGVRLLEAGVPVPGAAIVWTAAAPFVPGGALGATDAAGEARASFTPGAAGNFANVVIASHDPDGIAGNGDETSIAFAATITATPGLAIVSGDQQQAAPGAAFAQPLRVRVDNSGTPLAGATVLWSLTGDATLVPGGTTDAAGETTAQVTAGTTPGPVVVTASRQDNPAIQVSFQLAVSTPGALAIVSGDGQSLVAGTPSEPLVVELRDGAGAPVPGATIQWTTDAGSLASANATTDASGRASNRVTVASPGPVHVTASSALAGASVQFVLSGALENLPALDPAAREVAGALDKACPSLANLATRTAAQSDLYARCVELREAAAIDPAATAFALDQMMADLALAQANAGLSAAQSQFQNLKTRIAALRSGTGGSKFGGLALQTPTGPLSLGLLSYAFGPDEPTPEIGTDFDRWGFFMAGNIGRGESDPGKVNPAYDYDIDGLTAGLDYRWNDRWIVGGSLGLTRQDTGLPDDRGDLETRGWSVSGYTTYYRPDSWYVDGVLTWGRNRYEMDRRIVYTLPLPGGGSTTIDQRARSKSDGDLFSAAATFGRDFNRGAWSLGPYGRLLFTRLDFDPIEESLDAGPGTGLGLRIESRSVESLASVLGGKLTYTHSTNWGVLMPHLQLEWEHEFRDDPQALEARFLNDPSGTAMLLKGDALDTDYFRVGLGLSMVLAEGRSGFFYWEQLLAKDGTSQYNLALGFRMEF